MIGRPAPDFSVCLPDGPNGPDGHHATLADYRGRPLLLIFLRHLA